MFNLHKRVLKEKRLSKKQNNNKPGDSIIKCGGTGCRFIAVSECQQLNLHRLKEKSEKCKCRWHEKHQGQSQKSSLHDRSRWNSSKNHTKARNQSREIKQNLKDN